MNRLRLWAAALLVLALWLPAHPARAHASLVSSEPADGALLEVAPALLVLRFDEAVDPVLIRLVDGSGRALALGPVQADGQGLQVPVPQALGEGSYLLSYRVTSADSHPVAGSIGFSIGPAVGQAVGHAGGQAVGPAGAQHGAQPDAAAAAPGLFAIALRALRDAALLVAAGAALFVLAVAPFPAQQATLAIAGTAAAALSLLSIGVHGGSLLGQPSLLAWEPWRIAGSSSFGLSAGLPAGGSCVIAVVAGSPAGGRLSRALLALGALACVASLPLTGHAAAAHPRWFAAGTLGAHGLAAAFWLGSLVALHASLRRDAAQAMHAANAVPALRRFSALAVAAVALLLAAGIGFAWLQLDTWADLTQTSYGRLVLLKAALLAVLLGFAAANRLVLLPRLIGGDARAAVSLRRSIAAEIVLVAAVLSATAVLVQTSPHGGPLVRTLSSQGRSATVSLNPGRSGRNSITAALRDARGEPLDAAEVEIAMSSPAIGIEPIRRRMTRFAPGSYRYAGGELAAAGPWRLEIRARIDDFEQVVWSAEMNVRR